eukprot:1593331-Alexandrium_andersonii.AAC.1
MEAGRNRPKVGRDQESEAARRIVQTIDPGIGPILYVNFGGAQEEAPGHRPSGNPTVGECRAGQTRGAVR